MKIEYPRVAIVSPERYVESLKRKIISKFDSFRCEVNIDQYELYDSFLESFERKGYQMVFVSPDNFSNSPATFLQEMCDRVSAPIIYLEVAQREQDLIPLINGGLVKGIVPYRSGSPNMKEVGRIIESHRAKGKFSVGVPVTILGGGTYSVKTVGELASRGVKVDWYSQSLARGVYESKGKKIGYDEFMGILPSQIRELVKPHSNLESALEGNQGIVLHAGSERSPVRTIRNKEVLFQDSVGFFDKVMSFYVGKKLDALHIIGSNPPETLAMRAVLYMYRAPEKIVVASGDRARAISIIERKLKSANLSTGKKDVILIGEHSDDIFVGVVRNNGRLVSFSTQEIEKVEEDLRRQGPIAMESHNRIRAAFDEPSFGYSDAPLATAVSIWEILHLLRPTNFGYWQRERSGFLYGAAPQMDYRRGTIKVKAPLQPSAWTQAIASRNLDKKLREVTAAQRELAMSVPFLPINE